MLETMSRIFRKPKPIFAMVHTGPSPSAPGYRSVESAVERAVTEAKLYADLGVDGVVIIGHGRSNAKAIKNAVRVARDMVNAGLVDVIKASVSE